MEMITWMFLHPWHWSCSWIPATCKSGALVHPFDWKTDLSITHNSHPINLSSSHHPPQNKRGLYNRTYLGPHKTNRRLAVDTCRLSVSRKCIYLGNEGETFNFLKPISCQHWWLNISWARVWSGSGELPVRRFSRHSDWWGDISRAAVPYAVTRSYPPLYTVGQLSVAPPQHHLFLLVFELVLEL